jgi:putative transposase
LPYLSMAIPITEYPQYFTATNLDPIAIGWKKLLKPDKYKDIIINSLSFLVKDNRAKIFAFVIMDNHIHLIWQMMPDNNPEAVQGDFLKYTTQRIKKDLLINHPKVLEHFKVDVKDREYLPIAIGIWERNALSVELRRHEVFIQKLEYILWNPVKASMCNLPEEYKYSSALFYETGVDNWGFLTHYAD